MQSETGAKPKAGAKVEAEGNWCKYGKWLAKMLAERERERKEGRPSLKGTLFIGTVRCARSLPTLDIFIEFPVYLGAQHSQGRTGQEHGNGPGQEHGKGACRVESSRVEVSKLVK